MNVLVTKDIVLAPYTGASRSTSTRSAARICLVRPPTTQQPQQENQHEPSTHQQPPNSSAGSAKTPTFATPTRQVPYTQLSVATSERYTTGGGEIREKTEWHRAVAWGEVAESIASDFKKGDALRALGCPAHQQLREGRHQASHHRAATSSAPTRAPTRSCSKNEARIVGVVREDAKARTLDSGTAMTLLSVATTTVVNGKDREDWHSITLWGKTAEAARDIKAGDTIAINGSLRHRTVGDDGQERKLSAIDCRQFEVLERSQQKAQGGLPRGRDRAAAPDAGDKPRARQRSRSKGVERDM